MSRTATMSRQCVMPDLSPSWDEETVALLIGKSLHSISSSNLASIPSGSVVVEMIADDGSNEDGGADMSGNSKKLQNSTSQAKVIFASHEERTRVIEAYQGLAVPMTHGYHYYHFSDVNSDGENDREEQEKVKSRTSAKTPPLHLQLMAVPTKELDRRIQKLCKAKTTQGGEGCQNKNKKRKGSNKRYRVHKHASQCFQLCQHYNNARPERQVLGVPLPPGSTDALLQYLRTCKLWPPAEKQRKGVLAGNYLTVRKQHPTEYDAIWNLCHDLIIKVVPDAVYTALAITRSFVGSPHIDNHDKTFQHVIALGDFEGGRLCAEADEDGIEILAIDVRNRVGRIDGRCVHWVSAWNGERYSVVYYSTATEDHTDRVAQSTHTKWMKDSVRLNNI